MTQIIPYEDDANQRDKEVLVLILERLQALSLGQFLQVYDAIDSEGASELVAAIAGRVNKIAQDLVEVNEFSYELVNGRLDVDPPTRYNHIAANIKALHSQLRHLTWQAQRVQDGDYKQSVDFMGEFSEAFNGMIKALADRTERMEMEIDSSRKARQALAHSQQVLEFVLENINDIIIVVSQGNMLFSNDMAKKELSLIDGRSEDPLFHAVLKYTSTTTRISNADYFDRSRGRWYQIRSIPIAWLDQKAAYLQVTSDITERKMKEEKLNTLANTDELTGVASRRNGLAYLDNCLVNRNYHPISLCYLDIDGLKYVNDHYGHAQGDVYIKAVAQSIVEATRQGDNVSRMGGDEFMIVFLNKDQQQSEIVVKRIISRLEEIAAETRTEYPMSFSYGIEEISSSYPLSAEEYIMIADQKMYAHKQQKRPK